MTRKWDQTKIIYKQKKLEANTEQMTQNQYDMDYTLAEKENDKFIQQDREEKQFRNDTIRNYKEKHTESMIQRYLVINIVDNLTNRRSVKKVS